MNKAHCKNGMPGCDGENIVCNFCAEEKLKSKLAAQAAEIERLKTDNENLAWNLAGCSTIADVCRPMSFAEELARPALRSVNAMARDYVKMEAEITSLCAELDEAKMSLTIAWNAFKSIEENASDIEHVKALAHVNWRDMRLSRAEPGSGTVHRSRAPISNQTVTENDALNYEPDEEWMNAPLGKAQDRAVGAWVKKVRAVLEGALKLDCAPLAQKYPGDDNAYKCDYTQHWIGKQWGGICPHHQPIVALLQELPPAAQPSPTSEEK